MNQQKRELIANVRNDRMKGLTYRSLSEKYSISESSAKKYTLRNVLGEPVFYPVRIAKQARLRKVVGFLKSEYKLTFNSCYRFINSLGVKVSEDSLKRIFYGNTR